MKNTLFIFLLFLLSCNPSKEVQPVVNQAPVLIQDKITALAQECKATDPDVAAMLYTISGSIKGGDFTRQSCHATLLNLAKGQRGYLLQQARKEKEN